MKAFAILTLLILFLFSPCSSDARYLASPSWDFNIANLVKHTDLVVLGKVKDMKLIPRAYSTSITLEVESVIKGEKAVGDSLLSFTVFGDAGQNDSYGVEAVVYFTRGERVLLFMWEDDGDYHIYDRSAKAAVEDNKVYIPYTYKIFIKSDNEMAEIRLEREVELPLDLVVKVAKASIKDYEAIMEIEADVIKVVSLTPRNARPSISVELLKRLEETADQILKEKDESTTRKLETVEGKRLEPLITVEFDHSVDIPDPNLRAAIERELGRTSIAPIMAADMESLTTLEADRTDISDLTGLEAAINLTELRLNANNISDISALSKLTSLTRLSLSHNELTDISVLANLTSLTNLSLRDTGTSDISALRRLTNLIRLDLGNNSISDLSPLWELTNLTELELHDNSISDIRALWRLTNLVHLEIWDNTISDLWPLISNTGLRRGDHVSMDGNPLSAESINTHIPILLIRGVDVRFDTPVNISDPNQGTLAARWGVIKHAPVNIPDPNLRAKIEAAIELELGKPVGASITLDDMAMLTMLGASNANINDLTGLEAATSLTWLYLNDNDISDLSPLSGLTSLTKLELQSNRISDVSALSRLTKLTTLYLNDNNISDLSPLARLTNLTHLGLDFNRISDLSPLAGLTSLIHLGLGFNRISDLSPLSGLTNLILLGLNFNHISDLSPLAGLTNLIELGLETNRISDLSPLARLTNLTGLRLEANTISDLSPLARLTDLTGLGLETNRISDLSPLVGLTNLTYLWLEANIISDISVLAGLTDLTGLGLESNNISDISPLVANTGLGRGEEVYVQDNPWDRVKPHADSKIGEEVYVRNNPLSAESINTHIPTLQSRGVTVHFE